MSRVYFSHPIHIEARQFPRFPQPLIYTNDEGSSTSGFFNHVKELAVWCGGVINFPDDPPVGPEEIDYMNDNTYILMPTDYGDVELRPGVYLVKGYKDHLFAVPEETFERVYFPGHVDYNYPIAKRNR